MAKSGVEEFEKDASEANVASANFPTLDKPEENKLARSMCDSRTSKSTDLPGLQLTDSKDEGVKRVPTVKELIAMAAAEQSQKIQQKAQGDAAQVPSEKPAAKSAEKPAPVSEAVAVKPAAKAQGDAAQVPSEKPAAKPAEKPAPVSEAVAVKPAAKVQGEAAQVPSEKPAAKPAEKPAPVLEAVAVKPAAKVQGEAAQVPSEKPAAKPAEKPAPVLEQVPAKPAAKAQGDAAQVPSEKPLAPKPVDSRIRQFEGTGAESVRSTRVDNAGQIDRVETRDGRVFERTTTTLPGGMGHVWQISRPGAQPQMCCDVRVAQNGDLSYRTAGDAARPIRETQDGRYFVTGTDGVERRFVDAGQHEAAPIGTDLVTGIFGNEVLVSDPEHAGPPRYGALGGEVQNDTDRPIIVFGNGQRDENGNKTMHAYVLRPGQRNNGLQSDVDGFLRDPRFQPTVSSSGRILMPESIPADATVVKIRDTGRLTITGPATDLDWSGSYLLRSRGTLGDRLSGGQPVRPEPPRPRR